MTDRIPLPPRKDPQAITRRATMPPAARSRAALGLAVAAAEGRFALQVCSGCGTVCYPPRDACGACLSVDLAWKDVPTGGCLLAQTKIHATPDPYFRQNMPWRMGTVQLDAGPIALTHLHGEVARGARVEMALRLDRAGQGVLVALPEEGSPDMHDDPVLRETGCHPRHRRVLITDSRAAVTEPLVRALIDAGALHITVGLSESWRGPPIAAFDEEDRVRQVLLDTTDSESVACAAASLGGKTDIVIHTSGWGRPGHDLLSTRDALERGALGLLRMGNAFGPALAARSSDGVANAVAMVAILPASALVPEPGFESSSIAAAASRATLLTLRAQYPTLRVAEVLHGPLEDDWRGEAPPPKVTPAALARAIVDGLINGQEQVLCGDVAKDLGNRWREDPVLAEREGNR